MKSGFTLIELLVVIAIIGVLSSIVLVSLGDSSIAAKEVANKAELGQLRTISANARARGAVDLRGFCRGGGVHGDPDAFALVRTITDSINVRNGLAPVIATPATSPARSVACRAKLRFWVAAFKLSETEVWCVDSTGFAGKITPVTVFHPSTIALIGSSPKILTIGSSSMKCN